MNRDEMKNRTKEFCNRIIKLCRKLSDNRGGRLSKLRIVDFGFWNEGLVQFNQRNSSMLCIGVNKNSF